MGDRSERNRIVQVTSVMFTLDNYGDLFPHATLTHPNFAN
jgi:hypothetical protein